VRKGTVLARGVLDTAEIHLAGIVSLSRMVDMYGVGSRRYYRVRYLT